MEHRPLGRTGVQVSPLCLGAMMFGPWGNDDRADLIRIIHRTLDARINVVDTGITLIEMAIAFVLNHPGVTSAIVGPRTMEQLQSYLPAADINPDDNSYGDHELTPAARRR